MLELLAQYAINHELVVEPGFAPKEVRWCIVLDENGAFMELIDLDPQGKRGRLFPKAPDLKQNELIAGGVTRSHFMVEATEVVALFGIDNIKEEKNRNRSIAKHEYFIKLLEESATACSENLKCARFLENESNLREIQARLATAKAKKKDKITFKVGECFPLEKDTWHSWWRNFRGSLTEKEADGKKKKMRCFQTGDMVEPIETHPKIAGLSGVGGLSMGCILVGCDKEAFCSFGLEQSANAAISEEAASMYQSALNDLIRNGKKLAGTIVVHWYKEKIRLEDDPLNFLVGMGNEAEEELDAKLRANKLLDSVRTGEKGDLARNKYYSMVISATGGRVMLREWMEGDFVTIAGNIADWFDDLSIINREGIQCAKDPKFMAVLGSTVRDLDELNAPFVAKMWRSAVYNELIPEVAMAKAVLRIRAEMVDPDKVANHARMGLMKAYHLRKSRKNGGVNMPEELLPCLNENHSSKAYQAGRLMAVLSDLQRRALGDVGAGVVERYYAAASMTPAMVLGRLTRLSQHHLSKLQKGSAVWYEGIIAGIWNQMKDDLPSVLNMEEQSLFALGYYQQIAWLRGNRTKNENKEAK